MENYLYGLCEKDYNGKKMIKTNCDNCYVEVKRYTIFVGIIQSLILTIVLMIPIFNIFLLKEFCKDEVLREDFWKGIFYNIEKIPVRSLR
jgi:hypothetical protein